jgi:hypothetical protein
MAAPPHNFPRDPGPNPSLMSTTKLTGREYLKTYACWLGSKPFETVRIRIRIKVKVRNWICMKVVWICNIAKNSTDTDESLGKRLWMKKLHLLGLRVRRTSSSRSGLPPIRLP